MYSFIRALKLMSFNSIGNKTIYAAYTHRPGNVVYLTLTYNFLVRYHYSALLEDHEPRHQNWHRISFVD